MPKILITHVPDDLGFVTDLYLNLKDRGYELHLPDKEAESGTIIQELFSKSGYDAILVIISDASLKSSNFLFELGKAQRISELDSEPTIIPIILDDVSHKDLPANILSYNSIRAKKSKPEETARLVSTTIPLQIGKKSAEKKRKI